VGDDREGPSKGACASSQKPEQRAHLQHDSVLVRAKIEVASPSSIAGRYPGLQATLFELPATVAQAQKRLAHEPVKGRLEIIEGDALIDPLPKGYDAVLMAGFVHLFDPERIARVLGRTREAVDKRARLLIVDQWMDSTHTKPAFGALLAGTYLILSGNGRTYSVEEAQGWLETTGWRFMEHRGLAGATSVVIAEAS